jgi:hypothetical protein
MGGTTGAVVRGVKGQAAEMYLKINFFSQQVSNYIAK